MMGGMGMGGMGGMGMGGMGGMGMRGGGMGMGGGMGQQGMGQQLGPDGQPIPQSFLQKLGGWVMGGMEMMQMPMMMFSQVMMMVQQQAQTMMMAVMMLPSMLEMLPMVTEQVKSLMGRSDKDPQTGLTIPGVDYTPPPWKTRTGRKVERRLLNLCSHVAVLGPAVEFGLKTAGLEPRPLEELNYLDWSEIMKKVRCQIMRTARIYSCT